MASNVLPCLEFIFVRLQERYTSPAGIQLAQFCTALARFQRYLHTAVSPKSMYQLARSRKVAQSHSLVYAELGRLLDSLEVPEEDLIRVWRYYPAVMTNYRVSSEKRQHTRWFQSDVISGRREVRPLTIHGEPPRVDERWSRSIYGQRCAMVSLSQ